MRDFLQNFTMKGGAGQVAKIFLVENSWRLVAALAARPAFSATGGGAA